MITFWVTGWSSVLCLFRLYLPNRHKVRLLKYHSYFFNSHGLSVTKNTFCFLHLTPDLFSLGIGSQQYSYVSLLAYSRLPLGPSHALEKELHAQKMLLLCLWSTWAISFCLSVPHGLHLWTEVVNESSCHQVAKFLQYFPCR